MPNGFDPLGFLGGVGDLIVSILTGLVNFLAVIVEYLFAVVTFLWQILVLVVQFLGRAFTAVFRGIRHVISDIVHGRLKHLFDDYLKLKQKLKEFFEPVLRILRRIRQIYDDFFRRYVRPVLNLLQRVRRVLAIFRVLHLKWAETLDRKIAKLEGQIIHNVLVLRQRVNQILSILELVLNPELLIRGSVLLSSIIAAIDDLLRAMGWGGLASLIGQAGTGSPSAGAGHITRSEAQEVTHALLAGRGLYAEASAQALDAFQAVYALDLPTGGAP